MVKKEVIMDKLRDVTDPELHVNIVDLGLVYEVKIDKGMATIIMTLTSPACPVGPLILESIEDTVNAIEGVKGVNVEIVWDPPWGPDKMSDEAKLELGVM